jgi:hypothetical protein
VPASILDDNERGKAFWNVGKAALGSKIECARVMCEVAWEVVQHYSGEERAEGGNTTSRLSLDSTSASSSPEPPVITHSLADAATMYAISAREGIPAAQRELSLFYLSHPDLVPLSLIPLSRPREVFRTSVLERYGEQYGVEEEKRRVWAVAAHWMESASRKGDEVARERVGEMRG